MIHVRESGVSIDNNVCFANPQNIDEAWERDIDIDAEVAARYIRGICNELELDTRIFLGAIPKLVAYNYLRLRYSKPIIDPELANQYIPNRGTDYLKTRVLHLSNDLHVPFNQVMSFGRNMDSIAYKEHIPCALTENEIYLTAIEYYATGTEVPLIGTDGIMLLL